MAIAAKNDQLTTYAVDYIKKTGAFIYDVLSPVVRVKSRTFRYQTLAASNLARDPLTKTSAAGATAQTDITTTNSAAVIDTEFRNKILVTWTMGEEHADGMDGAQRDAGAITMHKTNLEAEIALHTVLGSISANAAATGGGGWAGGSAAPLTDLKNAFNAVRSGSYGQLADTIVIPWMSYQILAINSDMQAFVKGSVSADVMTVPEVESALSRLNGGDIKIIIATGMYDVSGTATDVYTGTAGSAVVYVLRQETAMGDRPQIRCATNFGVVAEEGTFDAPETSDPARPKGIEVESALIRKSVLTADGAGYRITGV